MTDETTSDARAEEGSGTGRRAFMAGAAGLAAGATLLGSGGPAGATPPAAGEHDLDLKWVDLATGTLTAVGLGTGGLAKARFVPMGDAAVMSVRVRLGAGATPGDGPWCLSAADMPSGYAPATPPDDITPTGTVGWLGVGNIVDFSSLNGNSRLLGCSWNNFTAQSGPGVLHVWAFADRNIDVNGPTTLLNYGGTVPFGAPLAEGAILYSSIVYERAAAE